VVLSVFYGVFRLVESIRKSLKERAGTRTAATLAKDVWNRGAEVQRRAMLELINLTEGAQLDSLVAKAWDDLPELVRTSITKSFRR
jgi:hypothetical protein